MKGNFRSGSRPTLKERLARRREANQRLAQVDASNRCGTCKAPLTAPVFTLFGDPRKFCSSICLPPVIDRCVAGSDTK